VNEIVYISDHNSAGTGFLMKVTQSWNFDGGQEAR